MKNQQCPKPDCMYLHELGDSEASFTKEEMHQGKHQEYEKRLHDALIAATAAAANSATTNGNGKLLDEIKSASDSESNGQIQNNKEAWPCLSVSPVNKDSNKTNGGKGNKENTTKKSKGEKTKGKKSTNNNNSNSSSSSGNTSKGSGLSSQKRTDAAVHKGRHKSHGPIFVIFTSVLDKRHRVSDCAHLAHSSCRCDQMGECTLRLPARAVIESG